MKASKISRRRALELMVAGTAGAFLASCAPTAAPKPTDAKPASGPTVAPKSVTLVHWIFADTPREEQLHKDMIEKYVQANPGLTVKVDSINPVAELRKKLMTAFAAGAGMPDCCEGQSHWIAELERAKVQPDYEERLKTWKYAKDWLPTILDLSRGNNPTSKPGILTNKVQVQYTYVRQDWLKAAGLKLPETHDDVLNVAKALNKPPEHYGIAMRAGDGGFWGFQLANYLRGNGVEIIKADGTTDIDSPEAIATVEWFLSWHTVHKVTQPSLMSDKYPELFAQLQNGKLAMFEHGLWSYKTMEVLGDALTAFPKTRGKKGRFVPCSTEGPMFFNTSKHQDEAWGLCTYLAEPEQTATWAKERGACPTYKQQVDDPFFKENRFFKAALDSAPDWGQIPYHKNSTKMNDLLLPEFQLVLQGNSTPEKFCKALAKALRED